MSDGLIVISRRPDHREEDASSYLMQGVYPALNSLQYLCGVKIPIFTMFIHPDDVTNVDF